MGRISGSFCQQVSRGFHTPPYCLRQQGPTRRTLAGKTPLVRLVSQQDVGRLPDVLPRSLAILERIGYNGAENREKKENASC